MLNQPEGGSIVNISSVLGLVGLDPDLNPRVNYIASKHGVIGLTSDRVPLNMHKTAFV